MVVKKKKKNKTTSESRRMKEKAYCGLDIHKETDVATIIQGSQKLLRKFEISLGGYGDLISWLKENSCNDVVMEATGVLWIPTYEALTAAGINATLANPEQVKAIPGKKTDVKDSEWLATLLKGGLIKPCYVPEGETKKLRELCRTRGQFVRSRTDFANRVHRILDRKGIALSAVYSDVFCKASREVLDGLVRGKPMQEIIGSTENAYILDRREKLLKAEKGRLDESDILQLRLYLETIDYLNSRIGELEEMILSVAPKGKVELLDSMPGIAKISAANIIGEMGDERRFGSDSQVASYAGMNSSVYQSAGKTYYGPITKKGNKWLRTAMTEAALAAIRVKNTGLREFYNRIKSRHGHKKAVVALGRKMLGVSWHLLMENEPYHEVAAEERDKKQAKRLEAMARTLKLAGYSIDPPSPGAAH
jgi:transposase